MMAKILIAAGIYPPESGGPATYAHLIAKEFPKRGIGTDLVLFRDVRYLPPIIRHLAYCFKVYRKARHADLIFVQDAVSVGLPAMIAAFFARKPLVVRLGGNYSWEQGAQRFGVKDSLDEFVRNPRGHGFFVWLFVSIERFVCLRAKKIIVPSEYLKRVIAQFGVPKENIIVIYNAYDPVDIRETKEEIKKRLGISGFTVLSAGRFVPWKGFGGVMEAVARAKKEIPDTRLILVGDGPMRAALESAARKTGIAENVTFTGALPRSETLAYLRAADAFVLNTAYEGFAHFVLEAAALGTPIATTDIPGNAEFLKDGESALLFSVGDTEAIVRTITRIHNDSALGARLARAAEEIPKKFSSERLLAETEKTLRALVR